MNCRLAIYDREVDYANHLMEYIKRKQKKLSQVRVFTNSDSLVEYSEQNPIQILLINESIPIDEIKQDNIKNICLLSEDNDSAENGTHPVIYKFQSAEIVIKELFSYYPLQENQGRTKNPLERNVEIINVFSICSDINRQIFSFSLANQYAALKKTLYINLGIFQVLATLLRCKAEKGLSDFIYFLKQNNPNIINKMNGIITKQNDLDYMEGVSFGPDLYELTSEDMTRWISEMVLNTDYEVIIFDVGSYFQAILELFRNSNKLLLLVGNNSWDQIGYNNFKDQLNWSGYEDILEKISLVPISDEEKLKVQNMIMDNFELEVSNYSLAAGYIEA